MSRMIDREKVLAVLQKRFPRSSLEERAAAANAIVGLSDEWMDVAGWGPELNDDDSAPCANACFLAAQRQQGAEVRILVKRRSDG
jgi:hypothetical protein